MSALGHRLCVVSATYIIAAHQILVLPPLAPPAIALVLEIPNNFSYRDPSTTQLVMILRLQFLIAISNPCRPVYLGRVPDNTETDSFLKHWKF